MPIQKAAVLVLVVAHGLAWQSVSPAPHATVDAIEAELAQKLTSARRIFVDRFGDDPVSKSLAAMVGDAIRETHRFIVTENREKADLILKGTALGRTSQEFHALGSSTSVSQAAGSYSGSVSGTSAGISGSSAGRFAAGAAAIDDSQASTENPLESPSVW